MPKKTLLYAPKPEHAAEWRFTANKATRAKYPSAPGDQIGMDLQDDEVMMLSPVSTVLESKNLIVTVKEGRIELLNVDEDWEEVKTGEPGRKLPRWVDSRG